MSADKYPSIFSRQMKAIVYLSAHFDFGSTGDRLLSKSITEGLNGGGGGGGGGGVSLTVDG